MTASTDTTGSSPATAWPGFDVETPPESPQSSRGSSFDDVAPAVQELLHEGIAAVEEPILPAVLPRPHRDYRLRAGVASSALLVVAAIVTSTMASNAGAVSPPSLLSLPQPPPPSPQPLLALPWFAWSRVPDTHPLWLRWAGRELPQPHSFPQLPPPPQTPRTPEALLMFLALALLLAPVVWRSRRASSAPGELTSQARPLKSSVDRIELAADRPPPRPPLRPPPRPEETTQPTPPAPPVRARVTSPSKTTTPAKTAGPVLRCCPFSPWNDFQQKVGDRGFSKREVTAMYQARKAVHQRQQPPQQLSAAAAAGSALTPVTGNRTARQAAKPPSPTVMPAMTSPPAERAAAAATGADPPAAIKPVAPKNKWNTFQKAVARRGFTKAQLKHMYAALGAGPSPLAWNRFQAACGGLGYSKEQLSSMYAGCKAAERYFHEEAATQLAID